jgi:endonuclease/exonuclease/phosphatase family metal-dependent hydrolase
MTTFKVMTWNLENLYRPNSQFGPKTQDEFEQKLDCLTKIILDLDADVLAVQEVGSKDAFKDLVDRLQGRYPHTKLSAKPDSRGIRVGFLSKLAIEESEDIVDFPKLGLPSVQSTAGEADPDGITQLSRGALRILVKPKPNLPVHLINAHLKSKLLTFASQGGKPRFTTNDENERARVAGIALLQRTAEAVALRVAANELLEERPQDGLIVLGDLNDVTDAATTQIFKGPQGSEIGTSGFDRPDAGDKARLFNLAPLIPEARRFSRVYKSSGELIDHIFASEELFPGRPRKLPQVDSHVDLVNPDSIGDNPSERRGEPGSDHAPITATFEL